MSHPFIGSQAQMGSGEKAFWIYEYGSNAFEKKPSLVTFLFVSHQSTSVASSRQTLAQYRRLKNVNT